MGGSSSQPRTNPPLSPINAFPIGDLYSPQFSDSFQDNTGFAGQEPKDNNPHESFGINKSANLNQRRRRRPTLNRQKNSLVLSINLNNTVDDEDDVQEIRRPEGRDNAKNLWSSKGGRCGDLYLERESDCGADSQWDYTTTPSLLKQWSFTLWKVMNYSKQSCCVNAAYFGDEIPEVVLKSLKIKLIIMSGDNFCFIASVVAIKAGFVRLIAFRRLLKAAMKKVNKMLKINKFFKKYPRFQGTPKVLLGGKFISFMSLLKKTHHNFKRLMGVKVLMFATGCCVKAADFGDEIPKVVLKSLKIKLIIMSGDNLCFIASVVAIKAGFVRLIAFRLLLKAAMKKVNKMLKINKFFKKYPRFQGTPKVLLGGKFISFMSLLKKTHHNFKRLMGVKVLMFATGCCVKAADFGDEIPEVVLKSLKIKLIIMSGDNFCFIASVVAIKAGFVRLIAFRRLLKAAMKKLLVLEMEIPDALVLNHEFEADKVNSGLLDLTIFIVEAVSSSTRWIKAVAIKVNVLALKTKLDNLPTRLNISRRGWIFTLFYALHAVKRCSVKAADFGDEIPEVVLKSLKIKLIIMSGDNFCFIASVVAIKAGFVRLIAFRRLLKAAMKKLLVLEMEIPDALVLNHEFEADKVNSVTHVIVTRLTLLKLTSRPKKRQNQFGLRDEPSTSPESIGDLGTGDSSRIKPPLWVRHGDFRVVKRKRGRESDFLSGFGHPRIERVRMRISDFGDEIPEVVLKSLKIKLIIMSGDNFCLGLLQRECPLKAGFVRCDRAFRRVCCRLRNEEGVNALLFAAKGTNHIAV
ncbi:hypothetical protein Tco_0155349 [Tanacetum coccineum]